MYSIFHLVKQKATLFSNRNETGNMHNMTLSVTRHTISRSFFKFLKNSNLSKRGVFLTPFSIELLFQKQKIVYVFWNIFFYRVVYMLFNRMLVVYLQSCINPKSIFTNILPYKAIIGVNCCDDPPPFHRLIIARPRPYPVLNQDNYITIAQ